MKARDYQEKTMEAVLSEYDKGVRRMLVSSATGTGKTVVMSCLYERLKSRLPGQLVVLAHREELIDQNISKMRLVNPDIKVDKEMADHKADASTADVIMASVATLGRKNTKRTESYNWENVDKLFIDEAHHSTADSYKNVIELWKKGNEDKRKLLLGMTATPQRGDGRAMAEIYEKIAYVYSIRQAIEDGWLVDVRGYRVKTDTDISSVKTSGGDFAQNELADAVNNPLRNQKIVKAWLDVAENKTTVAFCVDIKHAKDLADLFEQSGVTAAAVWGDDPNRAEKLEMLRRGQIKVLCNCAVLTEGFDCWQIGCVVMARPTKSSVWFTQAAGRATRLQDGTGNLKQWLAKHSLCAPYTTQEGSEYYTPIKKDCIILDVVDNTTKHSLITVPSLLGLNAGIDLRGQSVLGSVKAIEDQQKKYPSIDFSQLKDITLLKSFVESVSMFEVRFPPEVENNSELVWFRAVDGGYRMLVPKEGEGKAGSVDIFENLLGQWEIVGTINGRQFRGFRTSMEEAFKTADEQVRGRLMKGTFGLVKREATWHKKAASLSQLKLLKKLFPWKHFPTDLTSGQASKLINERLTTK